MSIRAATLADASAIAAIYNYYVTDTVVTFEEIQVTPVDILARMTDVFARELPWIVWDDGEQISGYAYANRFRDRIAYRFSVEATVYLDQSRLGQRIGSALYEELLLQLRDSPLNLRCVIGGIALPNEASVKLHKRLGFEKIGIFPNVGYKFDRWIDVGFWQLNLR